MEVEEAKKILEKGISIFPSDLKEATKIILAEMNYLQKKVSDTVNALKVFETGKAWLSVKNLPNEIWKDIVGYENIYQVSNLGRVKSFHRGKIKILHLTFKDTGYVHVKLFKNFSRKTIGVHRLVAQAFIPNPNNLPVVNHINNNHSDNRVENLEWTTVSENTKHAYKIGAIKVKKGENAPNAKLSDNQAEYIRQVYKPLDKEFGGRALAKKFNVTPSTISDIAKGRTRKQK